VAYSVSRRTREIGIRMALGAGRGEILGMVVRQGLMLTGMGLIVGMALAFAAAQALKSQLLGLQPTDPVSFAGTTVLLLVVSLAACALPARRASRLDPLTALRTD
jgi:ABC-type antimicrobial peptide transport system permease subunit